MSDKIDKAIHNKVDAFASELLELFREQMRQGLETLVGASPTAGTRRVATRSAGKSSAQSRPTQSKPTQSKPAKKAGKPAGGGKPGGGRRTAKEIQATADKIAKYVAANQGKGAEVIKAALGIAKNEWQRPLDLLIAGKVIRRRGEKRSAKYFPFKAK
jgi:predicted HTH transcriptional regulator